MGCAYISKLYIGVGLSGTMRPALFGWYWYCCHWTFVGRLPRNGTVQEIVYVCRVRALEHDRHRNHEKIVTLHRDFQSLLQARSHLVLRKAHIVLHSLGSFSDPKKADSGCWRKRTNLMETDAMLGGNFA